MLDMPTRPTFDTVLHSIAARQHGVVTRRQLLEAGLSGDRISRRVRAGRLRPLHRGVYRVGPVASVRAREMAACLACGPTAMLSHGSAAEAWGMRSPGPDTAPVEVTVRRGHPERPGIVAHRRTTLHDDERTRLDGIPITTPSRTLLDLAVAHPPRTLERALDEAMARWQTTTRAVHRLLQRHEGRPGTTRLRAVMARDHGSFTRSEAEERFLDLVRTARLEEPETNARVGRYEVDFVWRTERLAVEIDGYSFHASRRAFERDRLRGQELTALGYRMIRVTWRQMVDEPLRLVAQLAQALSAAGRQAG